MDDAVFTRFPLNLKVGPTPMKDVYDHALAMCDAGHEGLAHAAAAWAGAVLADFENKDLIDLCVSLDYADHETVESDFRAPAVHAQAFTADERLDIAEYMVATLRAVANTKVHAFQQASETAGASFDAKAPAEAAVPGKQEISQQMPRRVLIRRGGTVDDVAIPENFAPAKSAALAEPARATFAGQVAVLKREVAGSVLASINPMSSEAAHQSAILNRLTEHAGEFKTAKDVKSLAELRVSFPHFAKVISFVEEQVALGKLRGPLSPMRLAPMLLTGDPGLGKTKFAKELAKLFGVPFCFTDISTASTGALLSGSFPYWKGAKQGAVADALLDHDLVNPIFLVDELDKARVGSEHNATSSFHTLLEPETAAGFKDEFLNVPLNTSHFSWIFTSNSTATISEPLLSRMRVFEILKPTTEEMRVIAQSLYRSALGADLLAVFAAELPEATVDELTRGGHVPREALAFINCGLGKAAVAGRTEVLAEDIIAAKVELAGEEPARKIGF